MKCHYCEQTKDLRPYGPKGAPLCFKCMKASPEREKEAAANFSSQMFHCNSDAVVGTKHGPVPFDIKAIDQAIAGESHE